MFRLDAVVTEAVGELANINKEEKYLGKVWFSAKTATISPIVLF